MAAPERASDESGRRLHEEAARLAFPRMAGTEGDARVRQLLAEALRDAGLTVREMPFEFNPQRPAWRFRLGFLVVAATLALHALGIGGGARVATPGQYAVRLLLIGVGAAAAALAVRWDAGFFIGGKGVRETANLIGFAGASGGRRVLVVAHHDSKSQTVGFGGRALLLGVMLAGVAAFVLEAIFRFAGAAPPLALGRALTVVIAIGGLAALVFALNGIGNRSPGGVDNAGAMAVALEVARRFAREPEPGGELVVAFTGAEEMLMAGARRLVSERGEAWRDGTVLVVNLESVGTAGRVGILGSRGAVARALQAAAAAAVPARRVPLLPAALSDAQPLERAGFPVVTLTASSMSRAVRAIHTAADTASNLDPGALARTADLLERLVRDGVRP